MTDRETKKSVQPTRELVEQLSEMLAALQEIGAPTGYSYSLARPFGDAHPDETGVPALITLNAHSTR